MKNTYKKILFAGVFCGLTFSVFADSGTYICGHFRRERTTTVPALKASGFTFGILFNVDVQANGDLKTDGEMICTNGEYVFKNTSPYYVDDVNSLITGYTSIGRLEHCIGGWGNNSYKYIKALIERDGTGPETILYKNFKALKDAIPAVIAINNDIENTYDVNTGVLFHIMLYDIGFKTTIAPYMNKDSYWVPFVNQIQAARPDAVDRNYLQCYGGGAGNQNKNWQISNLPIYGSHDIESGGWTYAGITNDHTNWKKDKGFVGGFYWNYNWNRDLKSEAAAINTVYGGGEIFYHYQNVAMVYPKKDYKAPQTNFSLGVYSSNDIKAKGFDPQMLAALKLKEGIQIQLYATENNTGDALIITANTTDVNQLIASDEIKSWTISVNPVEGLEGKKFRIKNKKSGYYLAPSSNRNVNTLGMDMQQKALRTDVDFQIWTFEAKTNGLYAITNKNNQLTLQVENAGIYDGSKFVQHSYSNNENQQFILLYDDVKKAYQIVSLHSLKYISVIAGGEMKEDATIVQTANQANESAFWELIEVNDANNIVLEQVEKKSIQAYPLLVEREVFITSKGLTVSEISVNDMNGRRILNKKGNINSVDVSALPRGAYLLAVKTVENAETKVFTFVKN